MKFSALIASLLFFLISHTTAFGQMPTAGPLFTGLQINDMGPVPAVPIKYGGITFKYDNDNIFLVGGNANTPSAKIYAAPVSRGSKCDINSFNAASFFANANDASGSVSSGIDGGLTYEPNSNVLFYVTYNGAYLGQIKPGSTGPDKQIDLYNQPGYVISGSRIVESTGGLAFVPSGFSGAGRLKIGSYKSHRFYDVLITPDGSGTFNISIQSVITLGHDIEGILYIKKGCNPNFPNDAIIIGSYDDGNVYVYDIDPLGNPILSTQRLFLSGFSAYEGAAMDPATGDVFFVDYGGANRVVQVKGLTCPRTIPAPTVSSSTIDICSGSTANLTTVSASNTPTGSALSWHTATPATAANLVSNPSAVGAGTYYASFTAPSNICWNTDNIPATSITVNLKPQATPSFTQVSAICKGATLAALPTISTNGINGTWSPALNNTTTTTYTFTPTTGQCATTATMTITVNSSITPTFTQVAAICSGATLSALPTTSNNGITGSWSPSINNTTTTTYTFTPTAGQCATTATMTITVNSSITPTFTQVAAICSGATLPALPTTSNNGIAGTWSPALNNTTTTTYTFTPTAGQCATTATMTIAVNTSVTPMFTQVAAICSGATLPALPTTSNNSITGTWSPALNNTATTTYTFTPTAGQCATTATMTITVNSSVKPAFTPVAAICSGATLAALPTTSNNGINGTWSPALNNTATTTYTFTPTAGQCGTTTTMTITVRPLPVYTGVSTSCTGAVLNSVTVNASVSAGVLEYNIDGGAYQSSNVFTGLVTGPHTFSIRVQGTSCSVSSGSQNINCACPTVSTNNITADQNICSGQTPANLIGTAITITPVATFTYQWQSSLDGTTWTDIVAANQKDYAPAALTQTTHYRRLVKIAGCADNISAAVIITVNANQTLTVSCGSSTLSSVSFNWNAITGATSYSYTYTINGGTAITGSTNNLTLTVNSLNTNDAVSITVTPVGSSCVGAGNTTCTAANCPTITNNTITSDQTICANATPALLSGPIPTITPAATFSYQWQSSVDGINWTDIAADQKDFAPAVLTQTTHYRRLVKVSGCADNISAAVIITVNANQTLTVSCGTSTLSSVSVNWNAITGATDYNYSYIINGGAAITGSTNNLTLTVSGLNVNDAVAITVIPAGVSCVAAGNATCTAANCPVINNNTITSNQTICAIATPAPLSGAVATITPATIFTYQWQSSVDGTNWTDIIAANQKDYTPAALTQTTHYRRLVKIAGCADNISNAVIINITQPQQLIVSCGTSPAFGSVSFSWNTISNATSYNYSYSINNGTSVTGNTSNTQLSVNNLQPGDAVNITVTAMGSNICCLPGATTCNAPLCPVVDNNNISIDQTICIGTTPTVLTGTVPTFTPVAPFSYQWQYSADGNNWLDINTTVSKDHAPGILQTTTFYRRLIKIAGCSAVASNTVAITILKKIMPAFSFATEYCKGAPAITLPVVSDNGVKGTWNNASVSTQTAGSYKYVFTPAIGECATGVYQTTIKILLPPPAFSLGDDRSFCTNDKINLLLYPTINASVDYLWQDGSTFSQYQVQKAGVYSLTVSNLCGISSDTIKVVTGEVFCNIYMPNIFTPNGDGKDDVFRVKYPFPVKEFSFVVYNRWGQRIFQTSDINKGWDGRFNSILQPRGSVFVWVIQVKDLKDKQQSLKGTVLLDY